MRKILYSLIIVVIVAISCAKQQENTSDKPRRPSGRTAFSAKNKSKDRFEKIVKRKQKRIENLFAEMDSMISEEGIK